ncbi:unnamed protein product, partial [Linum tenue]
EAGGYDNLGYTRKDAYNYVDKERKEQISEGDAATVLAYLQAKCSADEHFDIELKKDDDDRIINIFWADSISVADYACFGELLSFDATYKRNIYQMPLMIFSGVNHHSQTCVFACAFLANEREDNYIWVLGALKRRLGGVDPKTVITDGDRAMRNAIQKVFPDATHRLCSWDIDKTITRNVKNHPTFLPQWKHFVSADWEPSEFEEKWKTVVEECSLQRNNWVSNLFDQRHEWGYAYLRSNFFAGLSTTSRCEGLNSQLANYIEKDKNLLEFFIHFDRWTRDMRENERHADFESIHRERTITSNVLVSLQKSGAAVFTKNAFFLFRDEVEKSACCIRLETERSEIEHVYKVKVSGMTKVFQVTYAVEPFAMECSCNHYNYMG